MVLKFDTSRYISSTASTPWYKYLARSHSTNHTIIALGGLIRTVPMTGKKSMPGARAARERVSVNLRKFSPCIARARRAPAGLTVYPPSRTLELLAFDEYCRFDTIAFF